VRTRRCAFTVSAYVRARDEAGLLRVLLIKHKKLRVYVPVGGHMNPNERPFEAICRELDEEIGRADASFPILEGGFVGRPAGLMAYEEHPAGPALHLNFAFVCDLPDMKIGACPEWMDPLWVTDAPSDAPANVRELTRRALRIVACGICGGTYTIHAYDNHGKPYVGCALCTILPMPKIDEFAELDHALARALEEKRGRHGRPR
jgi:8-oxo-dGTP pyrophosphatase MutT (NUDIX family)